MKTKSILNKKNVIIATGGLSALLVVFLLLSPKKAIAKTNKVKKQDTTTPDTTHQVTSEQANTPQEQGEVSPKKFWVLNDQEVGAPYLDKTNTQLITMDMPNNCNLMSTKKFRGPRTTPPRFLVIHWGGNDLNSLCATFKGPHETSSNVGTGRGPNGEPIILQFLDLKYIAWHAGEWRNEISIGLDVAQDPTKAQSFYTNKGYEVHQMNNTTGRGDATCLTIDPVVKQATQDAIVSLCKLFNIPIQIPRGNKGQEQTGAVYYGKLDDDFIRHQFTGVLGHFHTSNNKWDIAPWWEEVMLPILDK